jgi:hypothetical protein
MRSGDGVVLGALRALMIQYVVVEGGLKQSLNELCYRRMVLGTLSFENPEKMVQYGFRLWDSDKL